MELVPGTQKIKLDILLSMVKLKKVQELKGHGKIKLIILFFAVVIV